MDTPAPSPEAGQGWPSATAIEEAARRYLECYGALIKEGSQDARMRCAQALDQYDRLWAQRAAEP